LVSHWKLAEITPVKSFSVVSGVRRLKEELRLRLGC